MLAVKPVQMMLEGKRVRKQQKTNSMLGKIKINKTKTKIKKTINRFRPSHFHHHHIHSYHIFYIDLSVSI